MTSATISKWQFEVGTAASPQVLTAIEEVTDVPGIGVTRGLLDATNFDSPVGTKEYIGDLADGSEFTVTANYIPGAVHQPVVMTAVDNGETRLARLRYTGSSPEKTWSFSAVCLSHEIAPAHSGINSISFGFKITGNVTRA